MSDFQHFATYRHRVDFPVVLCSENKLGHLFNNIVCCRKHDSIVHECDYNDCGFSANRFSRFIDMHRRHNASWGVLHYGAYAPALTTCRFISKERGRWVPVQLHSITYRTDVEIKLLAGYDSSFEHVEKTVLMLRTILQFSHSRKVQKYSKF